MKPHVVVTGSAGYLGSICCEHLLVSGCKAVVIEKLIDGQNGLSLVLLNPSRKSLLGMPHKTRGNLSLEENIENFGYWF